MRISESMARAVHLDAQGLIRRPQTTPTKSDVLKAIRRMGALQIDTINVVARSPYFVLWSRLGSYEPTWLNELLAAGRIFEFWSHAACFLPIEDYELYLPFAREGFPRSRAWIEANREVASEVLELVRRKRLVRSSDFKREGKASGWWSWKPEKVALESLFATGQLMIARRDAGFQRVYALPDRVLRGKRFQEVSREAAIRALTVKAVRCLGIARASWVPDYFRLKKSGVAAILKQEVEAGTLMSVEVDGWGEPGVRTR